MILDDSSVMRKILERNLRKIFPDSIDEVIEAGDGEEAMEKLTGSSVSLIFADINMPKVNGLEFLRRLRESPHKGAPVIMVTTEGTEQAVKQAISLGAKGFVRKPFTEQQMESALKKVVPSFSS